VRGSDPLSGKEQKGFLLSATRTPPSLTLPLKRGEGILWCCCNGLFTSPPEGEVGAQRRERGGAKRRKKDQRIAPDWAAVA